jgi:hypothetical protein
MLARKIKSRMISIRLSVDDYIRMKLRCGDSASVSEFMRDAILRALSPDAGLSVESSVQELRVRMERAEARIEKVAASVGLPAANNQL